MTPAPLVPPTAWAAANPFLTTEFLTATGLLVVVLLGGAVAFAWADRWRKKQLAASAHESAESLSEFRAMFVRGELSRGEYERVRDRVAARLKAAGAGDAGRPRPADAAENADIARLDGSPPAPARPPAEG